MSLNELVITNGTITTLEHLFKLNHLLQKTNLGQNILSYLAPNIWYRLPDSLTATKGINTYKHKVEKYFLDRMKNKENNIYSSF